MTSTLKAVIEANEDHEWYPTTERMIAAVARRLPTDFGSLLDIGAGDGRVLMALAQKSERDPELYAIEKSHVLLQAQPERITPVGVEFYEQNLSCLPVDYIFSNPPYRDFEGWAVRIIETAFAKKAFLVIPQRWKDNDAIAGALKKRNATARLIHSDDFLDAERRSRAVVDIVEVVYPTRSDYYGSPLVDPFDQWFDQNISTFDQERPVEDDTAGVDLARVRGLKTIAELVEAFDEDYARMEANYRAIFQLDYALLKELGVSKEAVREGIKKRMAGLKAQYWQLLFERLDVITTRLSTATKKQFLDRLTGRTAVAFTNDNAYAIVMWAIRHANQYFDRQLVDLFKQLATFEGVHNYKSNQRTWEKSGWRYNADDFSHFALDYRIVVSRHSAIYKSEYFGRFEYPGDLHNGCHEMLDDVIAVMGNLGFLLRPGETASRSRAWTSGSWQDFVLPDGRVLFQAKGFMNGNVHLRFMPEAIRALNIEAGRLLGWLRAAEEVESELGYTAAEARERFGSNRQIARSNIRLLEGAAGEAG